MIGEVRVCDEGVSVLLVRILRISGCSQAWAWPVQISARPLPARGQSARRAAYDYRASRHRVHGAKRRRGRIGAGANADRVVMAVTGEAEALGELV